MTLIKINILLTTVGPEKLYIAGQENLNKLCVCVYAGPGVIMVR